MNPVGTDRFYHPELDILRFFAFLAVFIHHAFPQDAASYTNVSPGVASWLAAGVNAGAFGVDLFFVLSSYLITELLIREYRRYGRLDVRAFYIRRALRIWPLYFTFLAFAMLVVPRFVPHEHLSALHRVALLTFVENWAVALRGYPTSIAEHLWSVSIEEQFYLVWPLVIALLGVRRIGRLAVGAIGIAWGMRLALVLANVHHPAVWVNTFARLDPIALGALLAVWLRGTAPVLPDGIRIGVAAGAVLGVVSVTRFLRLDGVTSMLTYPMVAILCTALLAVCLTPRWRVFPGSAAMTHLGRVSYGLYVFHLLCLRVASTLTRGESATLAMVTHAVLGLAITIGLALASYRVLEQPFLRLKTRFTRVVSRPA